MLLGAPSYSDDGYDGYDAADGSSHTMVVPGDGLGGYGGAEPLDHSGAQEPMLARWLFSRRLAYVAAGLAESQAQTMLQSDGFKVKVGPSVHDNVIAAGDVISTSPSGRTSGGTTIVLTISSGPKMITVPPVTGHSLAGAIALLRKAGLTVSDQPQKVGQQGVAIGTVTGTNPPSGTSWPANKAVFVEVVGGPPVPNLVGQNAASVQANWAQPNGVNLIQNTVASDQPAGTIVAQTPAPGSVLTQGENVSVSVSAGPPTVQVPNIDGEKIGQATQDLQNAGFKVNAVRVGFGQKVVYYTPTGQAQQGATITVYYGF
jgi:serine/threonine-protein kinase